MQRDTAKAQGLMEHVVSNKSDQARQAVVKANAELVISRQEVCPQLGMSLRGHPTSCFTAQLFCARSPPLTRASWLHTGTCTSLYLYTLLRCSLIPVLRHVRAPVSHTENGARTFGAAIETLLSYPVAKSATPSSLPHAPPSHVRPTSHCTPGSFHQAPLPLSLPWAQPPHPLPTQTPQR